MHIPKEIHEKLPSLALLAVAFFFSFFLSKQINTDGIWINDEGNRMLAIEAYAENQGFVRDPLNGMSAPGLSSYCPDGFFVRTPKEGKIISAYSPYFPRLCAYLYGIGGFAFVRVAILACGLLSVYLIGQAGRLLGMAPWKRALAVLLVGLATPIAFYSGAIFELSAAALLVAFFVLSAVGAYRRTRLGYWALAAFFLGLVPWLREEGYVLFAAAIGAMLLCRVKWTVYPVFAGVFAATVTPLLLFNYVAWHSVFGLHHLVYTDLAGPVTTFADRVNSFYFFLFQPNTTGLIATVLGTVCIAVLFFGILPEKGEKRVQIRAVVTSLAAACAVMNFIFLLMLKDPVENTRLFQSLCATCPFVLVPMIFFRSLYQSEDRRIRFLLLLCVFTVLAITCCLKYQNRGIFFGARHYLLILETFALLAVHSAFLSSERTVFVRMTRWAVLVICFVSVFSQFYGLRLLSVKKNWSDEVSRTCQSLSAPLIVTDAFFVPEELAALPRATAVLYLTGNPEGVTSVTNMADRLQYDRIYLLTSDRFTNFSPSNPAVALFFPQWRIRSVCNFSDPNLRFMSLHLYELNRRR